MRSLEREGNPKRRDAVVRKLAASHSALSQADIDRLAAYVATAYLAEMKDQAALSLAEEIIARGGVSAIQAHWTAGLAAYRLGRFENAAQHFEAVMESSSAPRTYAAAAFWAARSWTRTGQPERVLTLYERAAGEPDTFYGLLATRVLGRDMNADFAEPALDTVSFAGLMLEKPAHRAVALWQIGHTDAVEAELSRAFGQMSPDLDPAFAALARNLGAPGAGAARGRNRGAHRASDQPLSRSRPISRKAAMRSTRPWCWPSRGRKAASSPAPCRRRARAA